MKYCICPNKKPLKRQVITKKYEASGLDNVILIGVEYYHCPKCGEEFYGYHNIEQLHTVILNALVQKKSLLTGKEIRFIRKHLGYSGTVFAKLIKYEPETIYRIENGGQAVTEPFDRLVRFFAASKSPNRDYDLHDQLLKGELTDRENVRIKQNRSGEWKLAA
jgi:putative transcriptional regulator